MNTQCYFTPVPSRRISNNGRVEFRLAASGCSRVRAAAVFADGRRVDAGVFEVKPDLELVKAYPTTDGLLGQFVWELSFEDADGNVVLNINRYAFAGKDRKERRMRAIAFASALVDLLNSHMKRRESK